MGLLADCLKNMSKAFPESERAELLAAATHSSEREAVVAALNQAKAELREVEAAIREELGYEEGS